MDKFFDAISFIGGVLVLLYLFSVAICLLDVVFKRYPLMWALIYPINKPMADDILFDHWNNKNK